MEKKLSRFIPKASLRATGYPSSSFLNSSVSFVKEGKNDINSATTAINDIVQIIVDFR
jgi:hypothetical protein